MNAKTLKLTLAAMLVGSLTVFADQHERPRDKNDTVSGGGDGPAKWSVHLLQTPGAPKLKIKSAGTDSVRVSWPSSATGHDLVVNTNNVKIIWLAPTQTIQDDATNKFILATPAAGVTYYRLEAKK